MHKFGGISGNIINNNQNEIINLANSENDRTNYLQNNEFFYNNNFPNAIVNQDITKNKQETLA
jgi:hypothetical protein